VTNLLAIALFCMVPVDEITTDEVDRVELSHVYDDCGRRTLSQLIFYDWDAERGRFDLVAWRLYDEKTAGQRPTYQHYNRRWESLWYDGQTLRRVRPRAFTERWDQFDPELRERDHLPKDRRRKLTMPRIRADPGLGRSVLLAPEARP